MHGIEGVVATKSPIFAFLFKKCLPLRLWATTPPKPCKILIYVRVFDSALCLNCVYVLLFYFFNNLRYVSKKQKKVQPEWYYGHPFNNSTFIVSWMVGKL